MTDVRYFTGSGHAQEIALACAEALGEPALPLREPLRKNAVLLLVFPVYCERVPPPVAAYLKACGAERAVFIAAYGGMSYGRALYDAQTLFRGKVIAAAYVPTEHAYTQDGYPFEAAALVPLFEKVLSGEGTAVFIPMSGMEVTNVTASTTMLEIPLDRLVSKVRATVDLTQAEAGLVSGARLIFSDVCPVVGLFEPIRSMDDITLSGTWQTLSYTREVGEQTVGTTKTLPDFYVNETLGSEGFTVTLETGNTTGVTSYTATTQTNRELPRNSILPLTLDFSGWTLGLEVQAWKSPIDEYPLSLTVSQESADTYRVTGLCEGGQFQLSIPTVTSTDDNQQVAVTSVDWVILDSPWGIHFDGNTNSYTGTTVKGAISGDDRLVGTDFTVEARVAWTDGADSYERTYRIVFADLLDITEARTRSAARGILTRSLSDWLQPETLTLHMKK